MSDTSPPRPSLWARARHSGLIAALVMGVAAWGVGRLVQQQARDSHAETLRQLVQPGDLKLISSTSCLFCTRARQYLTEQRIPFEECFIERDSACLTEYRARGAAGTPTVLVRGQARLGFDPGQVAETLAAAR